MLAINPQLTVDSYFLVLIQAIGLLAIVTIKPELNFEPSQITKMWWQYVRKAPTTFAGVKLPGLFQCSNFTLDTFGFMLVLVLEVWGLVNLLRVGDLNPLFVVLLFALDLLFAVCRHLPVGGICTRENRLVVVEDPVEKEQLMAEVWRLRVITRIFTLLILVIALFKAVSFQALQRGVFNGLTAAILVSYLISWVLHISATGYFLFGLFAAAFFRYDQSIFIGEDHSRPGDLSVTTTRRHVFHSKVPLTEVKVHKHWLRKSPQGDGLYELRTWGILTDDQLHALIGAQVDGEAKRQVSVQGVLHQLDILQSAPPRNEESINDDALSTSSTESFGLNDSAKPSASRQPPLAGQARFIGKACLFVSLMTMGCAEPQRAEERYRAFALTVMLTSSVISDTPEKGPEELRALTLPLSGVGCKAIFFPQVSFIRLDREPGTTVQVKNRAIQEIVAAAKTRRKQSPLSSLQDFYGQPPSIEELREEVSLAPGNSEDWTALAMPSERPFDLTKVASMRQGGERGAKMFMLARPGGPNDGIVERLRNGLERKQEIIEAADAEQLNTVIGTYLCEQTSAVAEKDQAAEIPPVVLLYQTVAVDTGSEAQSGHEDPLVRESPQPVSVGSPGLQDELRRIRHDIEHGALQRVRRDLAGLEHAYAEDPEFLRFQEEMTENVGGRIEVKLFGGANGYHELNSHDALVTLQGTERRFQISVTPTEPVYFYLYQMDVRGKVRMLFPRATSSRNPLQATQTYWLPSPETEQGYVLQGEGTGTEEIWMVMSRWPAQELERFGARLTEHADEEEGQRISSALRQRREARIGGCDVRRLQFAGRRNS